MSVRGLLWSLAASVVLIGLTSTARLAVHAQDPERPADPAPERALPENSTTEPKEVSPPMSVQDALLKPFHLPFREPTPLNEVCRYLQRALKAPVVLDLAALKRQNVQPDDSVQLDLEDVRLKTGLKLLLDQVKLTYRVVPEDNLLILTDAQEADDPVARVQSELRELHLELHSVQDALDDVLAALGLEPDGVKFRKPTVIEEFPPGVNPNEPEPPAHTPRARQGL